MSAGFLATSTHAFAGLGAELQCFQHTSGLVHYHLASDDTHLAFLLGVRTLPNDHKGLPHILEHSALCGSEKYPVRDPFFLMLRRSLQTFMNAMTGGDMTWYPFATLNSKDYSNLLRIYTDAVFAPQLDDRDIHQEGFHLEVDENKQLSMHGVVYNEMKGAMSDGDSIAYQELCQKLLPNTCYQWNSGGEPQDIPQVTPEDVRAFHKKYYRPSNAVCCTYGAINLEDVQAILAEYCAREEESSQKIPLPEFQPPLETQDIRVAVPPGEDLERSTCSMAWAWPDTQSADEVIYAEFLEELLLGHSGSPLRHRLESSGLCQSISGSGYMSHMRNGIFSIDGRGVRPTDIDAFFTLVEKSLEEICASELDSDNVKNSLHQIELQHRRIRGARTPYGLQLCERMAMIWNAGGDVSAGMNTESLLETLTQHIKDEKNIRTALRERFQDNKHLLKLRTENDPEYHDKREVIRQKELAELQASFTDDDFERVNNAATALHERQATPDDPNVLPRILRSDVPKERSWAKRENKENIIQFPCGTNGIGHILVAYPITVTADNTQHIHLLASLGGKLGFADKTYDQVQQLLSEAAGGINAWLEWKGTDTAWFCWEIWGLERNADTMAALLRNAVENMRFDEHQHIARLIEEGHRLRFESLLHSGHTHASAAATRHFSGPAQFSHRLHGIERLQWLQRCVEDKDFYLDTIAKISQLLQDAIRHKPLMCTIGDQADQFRVAARKEFTPREDWSAEINSASAEIPSFSAVALDAYTLPSAVNFCAAIIAVPGLGHADAGHLAVLSQAISQQYLHPMLRERGGAYGGSSFYRSSNGVFAMTSYRDPRLDDTFADMEIAIDAVCQKELDDNALEEAIISTVAGIDRPSSPDGEARHHLSCLLTGRLPHCIDEIRQQVVQTSVKDLQRVAQNYLADKPIHRAVLGAAEQVGISQLQWTSHDCTNYGTETP